MQPIGRFAVRNWQAKLALASGLERAAIGGNMSALSPNTPRSRTTRSTSRSATKHPIEDAGSHQRREVGWNRRSRFLPKWRTGWDSNIRRSNRLALGYAVSNVGFRDAASGSRTARKGGALLPGRVGRLPTPFQTSDFYFCMPQSGRSQFKRQVSSIRDTIAVTPQKFAIAAQELQRASIQLPIAHVFVDCVARNIEALGNFADIIVGLGQKLVDLTGDQPAQSNAVGERCW